MAVDLRDNGLWIGGRHLGDWLRTHSMTRGEFAERMGVSVMTVYRWERGDSTPHKVFIEKMEELDSALSAHSV